MKTSIKCLSTFIVFFAWQAQAQTPYFDKTREGFLVFHSIKADSQNHIIPWYHDEPGIAYDFVIKAAWNFWDNMRTDMNGLPYYMNHQVWRPAVNDPRGIGGDQFAMALSSWQLLYQYTGWEKVKENMKFIADYYITHSLAPENSIWPNIPYPYNCLIYSGQYSGDMVLGEGYLQPDKAGSFGYEILKLYQMTGNRIYLEVAEKISKTLASKIIEGNNIQSPLPFKVHALTGETGKLKVNLGIVNLAVTKDEGQSSYTSNWSAMMRLFLELIEMGKDTDGSLLKGFNTTLQWMKEYPLKTNKWGPFFEDIPGWSDTQTNAITFAHFMMDYPEYFPNWQAQVEIIFNWVYERLGNNTWKSNGVRVVNEQTVYQKPGNSHTSRQASIELLFSSLTGSTERIPNAIRQLDWATYMVDNDGKNCYPGDEVWLTDGYGDYIRHFLRAMGTFPELAPSNANHILKSTSIIVQADYAPNFNKRLSPYFPREEMGNTLLFYITFDDTSTETLRLTSKPSKILVSNKEVEEQKELTIEGWTWESLDKGGILTIKHQNGNHIRILK